MRLRMLSPCGVTNWGYPAPRHIPPGYRKSVSSRFTSVSSVIRPRRGMQRAQVEMLSKRVAGSEAGVADAVFEGIQKVTEQ